MTLTGGFDQPAQSSARAFRAIMEAMARPGRIESLSGAEPPAPLSQAGGVVLLTLCDPTTPIYLAPSHDTAELRAWIAFHCGAPIVAATEARFALGTWASLQPLAPYAVGEPSYPDRSATLIVEVDQLMAQGARLTGPGIADQAFLSLPETAAFQRNRTLFPLGFDCLFTCGAHVAALPRSTIVEDI